MPFFLDDSNDEDLEDIYDIKVLQEMLDAFDPEDFHSLPHSQVVRLERLALKRQHNIRARIRKLNTRELEEEYHRSFNLTNKLSLGEPR